MKIRRSALAKADIAEMPGIGQSEDFGHLDLAGLRCWRIPVFSRYLVFHRTTANSLEIIRPLHSARDIGSLFAG